MKLVIDEKLKHRLIGVSVILSLGAIFLPAMMKKSSQRLESNFSVNVQLPPKPMAPNVAVTDEEQMFKTIKIAKVNIPPVTQAHSKVSTRDEDFIVSAPVHNETVIISKVETAPAAIEKPLELALTDTAQTAVKREIKVAGNTVVKPSLSVKRVSVVKPVQVKTAAKPVLANATSKPAAKKDIYAVQLASFSKLENAQALVSKLQSKGYKANYARVSGKNGVIYKVYAGHSPIKDNVVKLRTQLASAMQLKGFIVTTGVS